MCDYTFHLILPCTRTVACFVDSFSLFSFLKRLLFCFPMCEILRVRLPSFVWYFCLFQLKQACSLWCEILLILKTYGCCVYKSFCQNTVPTQGIQKQPSFQYYFFVSAEMPEGSHVSLTYILQKSFSDKVTVLEKYHLIKTLNPQPCSMKFFCFCFCFFTLSLLFSKYFST